MHIFTRFYKQMILIRCTYRIFAERNLNEL